MPSEKPHVLVEEKYHRVLLRTHEKTGIPIPFIMRDIFETSKKYLELKAK